MATIEKLLVQIFDRKRQIIEKLKHQKQLYDQHLLSKLLIQGISPPPWLLNSDSQSLNSDLAALNKEELISELLLPKPGHFASYPRGPCFLYDEPVIAAANSGIPEETGDLKCASSNNFDENGPAVAPLCHVDGTEDISENGPAVAPPCHVDGTEDISVIPPSHVDDINVGEDRPGVAPSCQVDGTEDTAGIVPPFHVDDNDYDEDRPSVAPLCHVDGTEDTAGIVPPSYVNDTMDTINYVPMSPEDQIDAKLSNGYKPEQSLAKIHRSRSRQKALELRNSAKTSSKSRFGMENNIGILSGSKNCTNDEQLGLRRSLELTESSALPAEICSNEEVMIGNSTNKERSSDACGSLLVRSTSTKVREVKSGDSEMEKNSNVYGGRITRSRISSQQPIDGVQLLNIKSSEVFVSRTTRSKSGLTQRSESAIRNNSKANSGKITRSKSGGTEEAVAKNQTSMSRKVYVKPKQLDFDEVEESNLVDIPNHMSGTISQDTLEERSRAHTIEKSSSPCGYSIHPQSLGYEILEVPDSEIPHVMSKSNEVSGQTLIMPDCVGGLQFSLDAEATEVAQLSPDKTPAGPLVSVTDFAPRVTSYEAEPAHSVEMMKSESLSRSAAIRASSSSHGKEVGSFKLSEPEAEVQMLTEFNFRLAMDGSWPCYKRRKIEYQNLTKSSSPTLRKIPFNAINKNISNGSASGEKENVYPMSQKLTISHNSGAALSDCAIFVKETDWSVSSSPSKKHVLTPQVECGKDKVSVGRMASASTCENQKLSKFDASNVSENIIAEPSDSLPKDGKVKINTSSGASGSEKVSGCLVIDQDLVVDTGVKLMDTEVAVGQRFSHPRVHELKLSIGSPLMEYMNVVEADQTMPEFERFVISKNTADAQSSGEEFVHEEASYPGNKADRTSLPEKIHGSATLSTPVSPIPTGCKLYLAPGIYSSVPNRLLENIDLQSTLFPSGSALLGKSHSDLFSFPSSQYGWEIKKPFLSPVGKGLEGGTSKSGGSDKLGSSNLELTCFPILEDPESGEEDVNDAVNTGVEKTTSSMENSINRQPLFDLAVQYASSVALDHADESGCLESVSNDVKRTDSSTSGSNKASICDIAVQNENSLAPDHADERCSLGSVSTEISTRDIQYDSKTSGMGQRTRCTRSGKENKEYSVGAYSSKKISKTLSSRFSKPKLSEKSSLKSRGQSLSEKEQRHNNIVSNIKSFVPLVQQKQAAAVLPEKRDVKVKALQAAEAAKRAAEIKENERKQKKEAMKLERARLEEKNMKEIELKRKLKEEHKKKREAENAAKKRQREEEEKKEKERKRQRVEEARLQHKQAEEKLQAWKEESKCAAEDDRAHLRKDSKEKIEKQLDKGNGGDESGKPLVNDLVMAGNDKREADEGLSTLIDHKMSTGSSATGKVGSIGIAESTTPNIDKSDKPINRASAQQSYDISPYQCSDDEEEEEDEIPNKKFVPTWASKSCVAMAFSSLQHIDPDVIFPPGSFRSLEEVLLPRRLPQK